MLEFPLKFEHFTCEPYAGIDHRTALSRFETLILRDDDGRSYSHETLQSEINEKVADMDEDNTLKTYLVYGKEPDGKKSLACVFSLRCSSIRFHDGAGADGFQEIVPAVELVYLAVDKNYKDAHKEEEGIGAVVYNEFIVRVVKEISHLAGAKYLFLFAINHKKLVRHYVTDMDFEELPPEQEVAVMPPTPAATEGCKFLYQFIY